LSPSPKRCSRAIDRPSRTGVARAEGERLNGDPPNRRRAPFALPARRPFRYGGVVVSADVVRRRTLGTRRPVRGARVVRACTARRPRWQERSTSSPGASRRLPFDAYKRLSDDQRELVRGDTLDSLIRHPVPGWSGVHLVHGISQSLFVHGNALVAKLRTEGADSPPGILWPLNWAQINAYANDGGFIEWWGTTQFGAQERFISAADVMHFAWWGRPARSACPRWRSWG
jgi:hypothetical protein